MTSERGNSDMMRKVVGRVSFPSPEQEESDEEKGEDYSATY
jgi:hypothetical protein